MAIERAKIIAEALRLLDEVGIDGLTTRKLADRLGVQQPALYWHFANKRALLDAMIEDILRPYDSEATPRPSDDWDGYLERYGNAFRAALLSRRDGARVYSGTPPTEHQIARMDARLSAMMNWGFPVLAAMHAVITVNAFVLGSVLDEQADAENQVGWERAGPDEPPVPHEAFRAGLEGLRSGGRQAAFEAGLAMIIEGLKPLRAPRQRQQPRRRRSRHGN